MIVKDYRYPLHEIENRRDFRHMLDETCRLFEHRESFFEKDEAGVYRGIGFGEFRKNVKALGEALLAAGLQERERIGIMGRNCRTWAIAYYAVTSANLIAVPIDKELTPVEVERIAEKARIAAVIFDNRHSEIFREIKKKNDFLKLLIPFQKGDDYDADVGSMVSEGKKLLEKGSRYYESAEIDPDAATTVIFTSGTTGNPKGVMLSQRNIIANIVQMRQLIWIDETMTFLSVLPLHHVYECTCGFLCQVHAGTRIAYAQSLKKIPDNLTESGATNLNVVPLLLETMSRRIREGINRDRKTRFKFNMGLFICSLVQLVLRKNIRRKVFHQIQERFGGKLDLFITGGAAIKPEVSSFLRKLGFRVLQGYGITECSPFLAANRDRHYSDSAAGMPSPGCDIEIFDPDETGVGEIGVKGPNVMLGYYEEPELTAEVFRNGYFMTGDSGHLDGKGFLHIAGRKKDIIVTKNGKNIYPEEVELLFADCNHIEEIVIAERKDPESSDEVIAGHIYPDYENLSEELSRPADAIDNADIIPLIRREIREINKHVIHYKRLRYFYLHRDPLPKTTTKKVKRYLVAPEGDPIPVYR